MTQHKPTYAGGTEFAANELSPTQDEVSFAKIDLVGIGGIGLDAGGARATNLPTPSASSDAATKGYVDSAAARITVAEIDVGTVGVSEATVVLNDSSITANSHVLAAQAGGPTSNKDADEAGMDALVLIPTPLAGQLSIYIRGLEGHIHGTFRVAYTVGN